LKSDDSHNLTGMDNSEDILVRAAQGGVATGEETTLPALPVAWLICPEPYEEVARKSEAIVETLREAGCTLDHSFITLSFLGRVVLPEVHISHTGLVGMSEKGFGLDDLFA
jgi:adenine deaminase